MFTMKEFAGLLFVILLLSLAPSTEGFAGKGCQVSELPPTPTNADRTPDISGSTADAGTVVKYVCHTGHEIVGDPVLAAVTPAPTTTTTPAPVGRE